MDGIERSCPGRAGGHSSALAKSPMVLVMSAPTVASLQKVDCVSPALAGGDIVTTPALAGGYCHQSIFGRGGYCYLQLLSIYVLGLKPL